MEKRVRGVREDGRMITKKASQQRCEGEAMKRRVGKEGGGVPQFGESGKLASFEVGLEGLCRQTAFGEGEMCLDKTA